MCEVELCVRYVKLYVMLSYVCGEVMCEVELCVRWSYVCGAIMCEAEFM